MSIYRSKRQKVRQQFSQQFSPRQSGFSLIELMVALVIGLLLLAGVLNVFVGSRVTYSTQTGLAKLQENGRFAMSFLTRDIRQAGFTGCSSNTDIANTVRDASGDIIPFLDLTDAISGRDDLNGAVAFDRAPLAGTDAIEVRFADTSNSCDISSHNPSAATILCEANHSFAQGDVLVITDCKNTAVFQQSNTNNNNTISVIAHNTGGATVPGNCTQGLGVPVTCTTLGTPQQYSSGTVMRMQAYRYYVSNNSLGEPALYRERIATTTAAATDIQPDELVEGVENMQILYGEDTNNDGTANYYVPFDEVSDTEDIISVRVSVLVRSIETNLVQDTQTLTFNNVLSTFNDGRLRKVFTSTITLRNRL